MANNDNAGNGFSQDDIEQIAQAARINNESNAMAGAAIVMALCYPLGLWILWSKKFNYQPIDKILGTVFGTIGACIFLSAFIHVFGDDIDNYFNPPIIVQEATLYQEYSKDPATFNKKYDGKKMQVTGYADSYSDNGLHKPDPWVAENLGTDQHYVACFFSPNDLDKIKSLKNNELTTVVGTGAKIDGNPNEYFSLNDCKFAPDK
jgi:hypothetical protein